MVIRPKKKKPAPSTYEGRLERYLNALTRALVTRIRAISRHHPAIDELYRRNKRKKPDDIEGKHKIEYQCKECKVWKPRHSVVNKKRKANFNADHLIPCGGITDIKRDLVSFVINSCTKGVEGYQLLCIDCHRQVTNVERGVLSVEEYNKTRTPERIAEYTPAPIEKD